MSKHYNPNVKTVKKMIVLTNMEEQMIAEIMQIKSSFSISQIVRDAIFVYRRSLKAPYLEDTPAMAIKREKINKMKQEQAVPNEQYVEDNLEDVLIWEDEEKNKWVLFRKVGNMPGAVPLEKVKDWVKDNDPEYVYHKQVAGTLDQPYEEFLTSESSNYKIIREVLRDQYGVAITP